MIDESSTPNVMDQPTLSSRRIGSCDNLLDPVKHLRRTVR
jgi:hypothetical protein